MKPTNYKHSDASKATLTRLPMYLGYLKHSLQEVGDFTSATAIAKALNLGEIQVRKDLAMTCSYGRPKIGYRTSDLISALEKYLGYEKTTPVVLVGAGKLGRALMAYDGFATYGLKITACFDMDAASYGEFDGVPVLPMEQLSDYCKENGVSIGIIAVPVAAAQQVCDELVESGITSIWNLTANRLFVPKHIHIQQDDLALSLAFLNLKSTYEHWNEKREEE